MRWKVSSSNRCVALNLQVESVDVSVVSSRRSIGLYPSIVCRSSFVALVLVLVLPFSSLVLNTTSIPNFSTHHSLSPSLSIPIRTVKSAPSSRSPSPKPVLPRPSSAEEVVQPVIPSLPATFAAPPADRFPSESSHIEPVVMLDPSVGS